MGLSENMLSRYPQVRRSSWRGYPMKNMGIKHGIPRATLTSLKARCIKSIGTRFWNRKSYRNWKGMQPTRDFSWVTTLEIHQKNMALSENQKSQGFRSRNLSDFWGPHVQTCLIIHWTGRSVPNETLVLRPQASPSFEFKGVDRSKGRQNHMVFTLQVEEYRLFSDVLWLVPPGF